MSKSGGDPTLVTLCAHHKLGFRVFAGLGFFVRATVLDYGDGRTPEKFTMRIECSPPGAPLRDANGPVPDHFPWWECPLITARIGMIIAHLGQDLAEAHSFVVYGDGAPAGKKDKKK
jgi:hypothetical protein